METSTADLIKEASRLYSSCQYVKAIDFYQKILTKEPNNISALYDLSIIYTQLNYFNDSSEMSKQIVAIKNLNTKILSDIGHLYTISNTIVLAKLCYQTAFEADTGNLDIAKNLIAVLILEDKDSDITNVCIEVLSLYPESADIYIALAYAYIISNSYQSAMNCIENARFFAINKDYPILEEITAYIENYHKQIQNDTAITNQNSIRKNLFAYLYKRPRNTSNIPDELPINLKIPNITGAIAIQNVGSSGTLLLQSLLDNHPNILSLPALHAHGLYIIWNKIKHIESIDIICNLIITNRKEWFDAKIIDTEYGLNEMGDTQNESLYVIEKIFKIIFLNCMKTLNFPIRKRFIASIYIAYSRACGHNFSDDVYILFPIHSLPTKYATYLTEDFPETKFVHMVRDPIQTLYSMFNHLLAKHNELQFDFSIAEASLSQLLNDIPYHLPPEFFENEKLHTDTPYIDEYEEKTIVIKLEDIHERPKETLSNLCLWIGIPWSDSLMESTFNGKTWWNRASSDRKTGFDPKSMKKNVSKYINKFDQIRIMAFSKDRYKEWEYDMPEFLSSEYFQYLLPFMALAPFRSEIQILPDKYRLYKKMSVLLGNKPNNIIKSIKSRLHKESLLLKLPMIHKLGFLKSDKGDISFKDSKGVIFTVHDYGQTQKNLRLNPCVDNSFEGEKLIYKRVTPISSSKDLLKLLATEVGLDAIKEVIYIYIIIEDYYNIRKLLFDLWYKGLNQPRKILPLLKKRLQQH